MRVGILVALGTLLAAGACESGLPPVDPSPATLDLLSRVDLPEHRGPGGWSRRGEALESTAEPDDADRPVSWFHVPVVLPEEFSLSLTAVRLDSTETLIVGFRHLGRKFIVSLDRWSSTRSGLGPIDGVPVDENGTLANHNTPVFPTGRPVTVRFRVRKDGVRVTSGSWVILDWEGAYDRLGNADSLDSWTGQGLLIGTWRSAFRITGLELTPVARSPAR